MRKQIPQDWKQRKENYAYTPLSTWTTKAIIRQTPINIPFEGTASIMIGTTRNNKNFVKTENSWFTQLWAVLKHDFKEHLYLFSKYSQEQFCHQYHCQNTILFWHSIHPRAILVLYMIYSKFKQLWRERTCRYSQSF